MTLKKSMLMGALILMGSFSFHYMQAQDRGPKVAKSAILFIGDGMGPTYITGGRIYGRGINKPLFMESLPVTGMVRTYSSNDFTTDSAAAATAMASGVKTISGALGVTDKDFDPSGNSRELQTIMDVAKAQGKSIGLITTDTITGATPAAFYAHHPERDDEALLATQFLKHNLDLVVAGGREQFIPSTSKDLESGDPGARPDALNLIEKLKTSTEFVYVERDLFKQNFRPEDRVVALLSNGPMDYFLDAEKWRSDSSPPELDALVEWAIARLSKNKKGYLLMVEAAHIDFAGHQNWAMHAFSEVNRLDRAVKKAMDKAGPETLLVVTADHETGGLAINGYGPIEVAGKKLLGAGFGSPPNTRGSISWGNGPGGQTPASPGGNEKDPEYRHRAAYYSGKDKSAAHSTADVVVLAGGPGQQLFTGYMENTQIGRRILKAMGMDFTDTVNKENFGKVENNDFTP